VPDVHETSLHEDQPSRFVTEIALAKAQSVSSGFEAALVLGADTIVCWTAGFWASRAMRRRRRGCCAR